MKKRLILDEKKFVEEQLLVNGLSDYLYLGDIKLLIKYWRYLGVIDKKDLKLLLENYLRKFTPYFESLNTVHWQTQNLIYKIIGETKSQKLRIPVPVPVTENELAFCHSAKNNRLEKILFSMLVLSKYLQLTKPKQKTKKEWIPDPDKIYDQPFYRRCYISKNFILKYAGTKEKRSENLFFELKLKDLITSGMGYCKYEGSKSWIELKIDTFDDSPVKLIVDDIENLEKFYPFFCEDCDSIIEKTGSRKKVCGECRKLRERERVKLAMRKRRNSAVLANVTQ